MAIPADAGPHLTVGDLCVVILWANVLPGEGAPGGIRGRLLGGVVAEADADRLIVAALLGIHERGEHPPVRVGRRAADGVLIFSRPGVGAVTLALLFGLFSLTYGFAQINAGISSRSWNGATDPDAVASATST